MEVIPKHTKKYYRGTRDGLDWEHSIFFHENKEKGNKH